MLCDCDISFGCESGIFPARTVLADVSFNVALCDVDFVGGVFDICSVDFARVNDVLFSVAFDTSCVCTGDATGNSCCSLTCRVLSSTGGVGVKGIGKEGKERYPSQEEGLAVGVDSVGSSYTGSG